MKQEQASDAPAQRNDDGWWAVAVAVVALIVGVAALLAWGWSGRAPAWTGLGPLALSDEAGPKTLWAWLELLIVPIVLALGAAWFNRSQKRTEILLAEKARDLERQIADDRQKQATLEAYLERMTELLLNHNLRLSAADDPVRSVARALTLAVFRSLDGERKTQVFRFLEEARLVEWPVPVVRLDRADLSQVKLPGDKLESADLMLVDFSQADLLGVELMRANLHSAKFVKADMYRANLAEANLAFADLTSANLTEANLSNGHLYKANLSEAILGRAILAGAHLVESNFVDAILSRADMRFTDLSKARLYGADLSDANLEGANLQGTFYSSRTKWPQGFDPVAAGAILVVI